jgi:mono/diheme cytochrome c family protein
VRSVSPHSSRLKKGATAGLSSSAVPVPPKSTAGQASSGTVGWLVLGLLVAAGSGCQQKMADQPSVHALEPTGFFAEGGSARPQVPGTVARRAAPIDWQFETGLRSPPDGGLTEAQAPRDPPGAASNRLRDAWEVIDYVETFPRPVDRAMLERGQERFMIYCVVCHDPLGYGGGVVVERGFTEPPSYHTDRLRSAPAGYLFDVITRGFGSMPQYDKQVPPEDRWAIVAYIRALQLSQNARLSELPEDVRNQAMANLEKSLDQPR